VDDDDYDDDRYDGANEGVDGVAAREVHEEVGREAGG
jgi:hypothetical protein